MCIKNKSLTADWIIVAYHYILSLFSSHRKNLFAARCEYLHLIKKNSHQANEHCEFFLIRCKHSQRAANQFLWWLENRLYTGAVLQCQMVEHAYNIHVVYDWNFKSWLTAQYQGYFLCTPTCILTNFTFAKKKTV